MKTLKTLFAGIMIIMTGAVSAQTADSTKKPLDDKWIIAIKSQLDERAEICKISTTGDSVLAFLKFYTAGAPEIHFTDGLKVKLNGEKRFFNVVYALKPEKKSCSSNHRNVVLQPWYNGVYYNNGGNGVNMNDVNHKTFN